MVSEQAPNVAGRPRPPTRADDRARAGLPRIFRIASSMPSRSSAWSRAERVGRRPSVSRRSAISSAATRSRASRIDGNPEFAGWLIAQRQRYREMNLALLRELVPRLPRASEETFRRLNQWLVLAPFDLEAHTAMLDVMLGCGRLRDAEQHVAAAIRAFEQEGIDWSPLRPLLAERRSAAGWARADASTAATSAVDAPAPEAAEIAATRFRRHHAVRRGRDGRRNPPAGRRLDGRHHHQAGQAAHPLRHRPGYDVRPRRARRRRPRSRPHPGRGVRGQRLGASGRPQDRRRRAGRDASRHHRLARGPRDVRRRDVRRARRHRRSRGRRHRRRGRDRGVQTGDPEGPELA